MSTMRTLLLIVLAVSSCVLQSAWSQEPATDECYNSIGEPTRCVPITQSFSLGQQPTVNSTCGTPPSEFCLRRLTIRGLESDCSQICDASDPANAHPPNLMTDFLLVQESWWQSENNQEIVVIELSLQTMVEITVIRFGFVSFKPDAFYIQKSTDYGSTYTPFHFFSTSCIDKYIIDPELNLEIDNETTVLCQPIDVPPDPGQISFFPALGRPSANDTTPGLSEELYTFVTATDIRVVLDGFFVIDDLPSEDPGDYFYAIEDLNVVGGCQCNGHASSCNINPDSAEYQCDCQHNTAGTFCERCTDFYQDVPWQIADGREPFECKPCNCHEHSTECIFNPAIYAATGSVSGGECLNCANNTAGRQCETCIEFYYPRPDRNQTDPDVCTICGCDIRGVIDDGDCAREASEELDLGDCSCKENAVGRTCSQCKAGFFNLTSGNPDGCQACGCNETGSIDTTCHQATGVCNCKPNIVGEKCDFCEQGFYHADPNGQQGCQPCDCNIGGAFSNQCNVFTGQCDCRQGVTGRTCSVPIANHFFPAIDYLTLEGEEAGDIANHELLTSGSGIVFTGTGYYRVTEGSAMVNFGDITPPASGQYEILFRYNLQGILTFDNVTLIIRAGSEDGTGAAMCRNGSELPVGDSTFQYTSWPLGISITISQVICLRGGRKYTFIIQEFSSGQTGEDITFLIDSLVAIPLDIPGSQVLSDITLSGEYSNCVDRWRSVLTQTSARLDCEDITFALSTELYNGTLPCDCDAGGTEGTCDPFGGKCTCLAGITGRRCDQCEPGTYNSSSVGCSACNCSVEGSVSSTCDPASGLCSCLENVVGRDCSSCAADHWGLVVGMGCTACQCNATGSVLLQCDQTTGMCTCRPGVTGSTCDQCMELHYGFSDTGCSRCGCSPAGTTNSSCDITTGQCTCLSNTEGRDCSQCIQSTFNLQASNPFGCQPCFCSGQSTSCVSAGGYVAAVVLTEFNASDVDPLQGWTSTSSSSPEPGSAIAIMPFSDGITILANSDSYLEAPSQYLGNKLSSYAQFIQITLEPTGASAQTLSVHDVILSGNGLQLGVSFQPLNGIEPITVRIHLHEASGIWVNIQTNQSATAYELQLVLSHLDELLVTASYNVDIILYNISLDVAIQDSSDSSISWVEMCSCPANYTGLSCEQCASSYTRVPSGTCELCQCNGLSTTCDSETGECTNCTNMTTGASCEQCTRGTYGDPTQGIPCQACPCPLPSGVGQFTDECSLLLDDVVCLNCPEGHMGPRCEECAPGFFGDPRGISGTPTMCSDCLCNGNIDPRLPDSCDTVTGLCLTCLNNTAGDHCETCADGYYGDAITTKNCTECGCSTIGSNTTSTVCDHTTGQCQCLPNVEGQQCSQCAPNHYGLSSGSGCTSCDCHPEGAESSQCDVETGQCSCRLGVTGRACNQCLPGYFGLSSQGCQTCTCSQVNSISDTCDVNNGDCICTAGAIGTGCQECIENYFQTDQGCSECPECYQELQSEVNITIHLVETTDARIANLSTMVSPFDSRLNQTQNQVLSAVTDAQELTNEHERLNTLFTDLSNSIQSLSTQLVQLDTSLKILQSSSTPVFVLAQTAEELMNRTIQELNLAQEVVDEIATDILPAIQNSADSIQNSSVVGRMTANELDEYVATLSSQVDQLLNITNSIALISTSAILGAEELISLHTDNQRAVSDLQQNQTSAQEALSFLMTELYTLTSAIASTTNQIRLEFEDLAMVPSEAGLNDLLTNASNTEGYANSLAGEVSHQDSRLSELARDLNESRLKVDSILQQVSNLGENISNLGSDSDDAHQRTSDTVSATEVVIKEAEMILNNLQNFSVDSFDIGETATETLQLVRMINISAADALSTARNIEETVERSMRNIATAKAVAIQAQNISFHLIQDSTVDTSSLVANVSNAINSSLMSLDSIESSSVEASGNLFSLEQQTTEVDQAEMQIAIGSNLTINSEMLFSELNTSVNGLQDALQSIIKVNPAKLNNINDLIQDADDMTMSVDIAALYQSLNASLVAQQQRRNNLEQELASLEEEVAYFKNIMSILPEDCDSNL